MGLDVFSVVVTQVPYREFPVAGGDPIFWVLLNIQLSQPACDVPRTMRTECIIDSGATDCLFDASLAEDLGIKLHSGRLRLTNGIGGREETWVHPVTLHIPGGPVQITAGFKQNLGIGGLLGIGGFFEHFLVTFDSVRRVCLLDRIYRA